MNLEKFYTYPPVYHKAVNRLIQQGRHGGNTASARNLIAWSLRYFRLADRKRAQWERRHMLFIAGGFPVKNRSVVMESSEWKSSQDGCPECGADYLYFDMLKQSEPGEIRRPVLCLDCETSWTEVYRFSNIVDLSTPKPAN